MAIDIRKNGDVAQSSIPTRMREMLTWDPFREMLPVVPQLTEFAPTFDVKETNDSFVFTADVPGVKESDLEVTLTINRLTVAGKRDEEKKETGDHYYAYERSFGSFARSFTLPDGADANNVHASLKDGVLALTIGKTAKAHTQKIAIHTPKKS